jgi:hypothetical protein
VQKRVLSELGQLIISLRYRSSAIQEGRFHCSVTPSQGMCTLEPREETPMNSRPTIHQYRRLAEGLLRKALEAPLESKQDFIHHAVSYLAFARAQEQSDGSSVEGISSDLLNSDDTENRYRQVRAHRLPSCHAFYETVRAGGLGSFGPDIPAMAQQGAVYIDKIIQGAKPADLPVQQPAKYQLVINLKTAKALGLTVPLTLQASADEVIE